MNERLIISLEKYSDSYCDLIKQNFSYNIYERNEDSTSKLFITNRSTDMTMFYASCLALSVQNEYVSLEVPYTYSDDEISEIYRKDIKDNDISLFYKIDENRLFFDIHNLFSCEQKKMFEQYFKINNLLIVYYNEASSEYLFLNDTFIGFVAF